MPRPSSATVADSPAAAQPGVPRRLRRWLVQELRTLLPAVQREAQRVDSDRYRKHFTAVQHTWLLLYHGLSGSPSLRATYAAFAACPALLAASGLAGAGDGQLGVSFSQFAASNTSRRPDFLRGLLAPLLTRVRQQTAGARAACPPDLVALDSTFLGVSLKLAGWLPPHRTRRTAGVRVQVHYAIAADLPEWVQVSDTSQSDHTGLDVTLLDNPGRLAALAGRTLIIDLGYYSHRRLARLRRVAVHFVTRRQPQATVTVDAELELQTVLPALADGRITVVHDQRVTVGSSGNRQGAVLRGLRLVTAAVSPTPAAARQGAGTVTYEILTDRWDLEAAVVVQAYLWRWQIELFFRWLKTHLLLPRLLGYSQAAIELSVSLAILIHLLLVLAAAVVGLTRRSPTLRVVLSLTFVHLCELPAAADGGRQLALPGFPDTQFAATPG